MLEKVHEKLSYFGMLFRDIVIDELLHSHPVVFPQNIPVLFCDAFQAAEYIFIVELCSVVYSLDYCIYHGAQLRIIHQLFLG